MAITKLQNNPAKFPGCLEIPDVFIYSGHVRPPPPPPPPSLHKAAVFNGVADKGEVRAGAAS